ATAVDYAERLSRMGVPTSPVDVVTSGAVMSRWLTETHPDDAVYLVGEESLRSELAGAGVTVTTDAAAASVVIVSFDQTFDYAKWLGAHQALRRGARFFATNPDPSCPTREGDMPDCGGIIAGLE